MDKRAMPVPTYESSEQTQSLRYNSPSSVSCAMPSAQVVFGPTPQKAVCPSCHAEVKTKVVPEASKKTHIIAAILGLSLCCCIPYCIDSCKDRNHYCPNCQAYLGAYTN